MTNLDTPVVESERLILRGFRETDVDGLIALAQDPLIAKHVAYNDVPLREACWRSIALWLGHWALRGFGMWAVEDARSGVRAAPLRRPGRRWTGGSRTWRFRSW